MFPPGQRGDAGPWTVAMHRRQLKCQPTAMQAAAACRGRRSMSGEGKGEEGIIVSSGSPRGAGQREAND